MPNYSNRRLANLANAVDSATSGNFLTVDDSSQGKFLSPVWSTHISNIPSGLLDSSLAQGLFDSAYIQARQTDVGLDSAQVTSLIDTTYVQARAGGAGLDSAAAIALIDSAYVASKLTSGLDSAGISSLIDSDYAAARVSAGSGFQMYEYTSTAGQTVFDSTDNNGETLSYDANGILVFLNGVLLLDTFDYSASDGTSVTLTDSSDSGANVQIVKYGIATSTPTSNLDWGGDRAVVGGGIPSSGPSYAVNTMDYYSISSSGNASDFGDLITARGELGATGSSTRGLFFGGYNQDLSPAVNEYLYDIDYITIATTGNASDFGDMTVNRQSHESTGNGTRALSGGGQTYPVNNSGINVIDYVTIATTGNAQDFGDLTATRGFTGAVSDSTRSVFAGGYSTSATPNVMNVMDYVTIATTGNAVDFGDLNQNKYGHEGVSDTTRGVFAGMSDTSFTRQNQIEYITIQTTGNGTDFGDMTAARMQSAGGSDGTYGSFAGGDEAAPAGIVNNIERITIQTTGNAVDHGDLTERRRQAGGVAGAA